MAYATAERSNRRRLYDSNERCCGFFIIFAVIVESESTELYTLNIEKYKEFLHGKGEKKTKMKIRLMTILPIQFFLVARMRGETKFLKLITVKYWLLTVGSGLGLLSQSANASRSKFFH